MGLLKKLVGGIGMLCAFGCTNTNNEQERLELISWLDHHLKQLSDQVIADIENEKKGFYPHAGKTEYRSRGYIDYELKEKTGKRLEISQRSPLTLDDIRETAGYQALANVTGEHGYRMDLQRAGIDGDEVDSSMSLDEYIADPQEYFVIRVSGWGGL